MRRKNVLYGAALLAAAMACSVLAADKPKDGGPVSASGVLTDIKPKYLAATFVMIWGDGEDAPTKFALPQGFDQNTFAFPPKGKGIFAPSRVQVTYTKGDDGNTLATIKKDAVQAKGTVTGTVMFSDDFWVAVKPAVGPLDGYATAGQPGLGDRIKALGKGDTVTIKFHTDIERHRIDSLDVVRKAPTSSPATGPATRSAPTTKPAASQPAR